MARMPTPVAPSAPAAPRTSPSLSVVAEHPPIVGFAIVIVAASLFGTLGPLSRFAYDAGMQPTPFVAWRAAVGMLAAAAFVAWRISRGSERLTRLGDLDTTARVSLALAGLSGFLLNTAMFIAFDLVTVALALLGFYTYPVIVAVANVALGREAMDRSRILALTLAVIGMVAVVASQLDPASGVRVDALGFGLALGAAAAQAVFVLISRTGYRQVPASQAMVVIIGASFVGSVLLTIVIGNAQGLTYPLDDPSIVPLLLFAGLFTAAIPSIMFLKGIRLIGGTRTGILMLFEPVVGVALAALLLDERLSPIQVAGGVAILGAALILQRSAAGERTVAAPAIEGD
jgi:drug/metabolite transporter (DMT)-like permease